LRHIEDEIRRELRDLQQRIDLNQNAPLRQLMDQFASTMRQENTYASQREIQMLLKQWNAIFEMTDNNTMDAVEDAVSEILNRAKELKQQNLELSRLNEELRGQLEQQDLETQQQLAAVEQRCAEVDHALQALRSILSNYESQFDVILRSSQGPRQYTVHPDAKEKFDLVGTQTNRIPDEFKHPLPFELHFEHAVTLYSSSNHALEHAKSIVNETKKRMSQLEVAQEGAAQELKHHLMYIEQLEADKRESEKQLKMLQVAAEDVRKRYENTQERNAFLEGKLVRIGEGFQRIMC
jgi:chromosome segregation ATPase